MALPRLRSIVLIPEGLRNWFSRHGSTKPGMGSSKVAKSRSPSPLFLVVAVTSLTGMLGQRFYNQPALDVGRMATLTIVAPRDASVEDEKSTEEKRKAARTGAVPVLQVDAAINQQIYQDLQRVLDQGNEVRKILGNFPVVPISQLTSNTQFYLRETTCL